MKFNVWEELDGKVTVIECPNRLDASIADEFKKMMSDLVDQGKFRLVVDMGKTSFIDSSGLGSLVSRIAAIRANQGDIHLASPSATIIKLLEMTHLDQIFKLFDDVKSAVESFE